MSEDRTRYLPSKMDRWIGRFALVTGASSGIGSAIAASLAKHGVNVIGCGRSVDKIEELAKSSKADGAEGIIFATKCDLRKEDDILAMFRDIKKNHGRLDICVNNAGVVGYAPLLDGETEKWKEMLEVNVLALSICTREAVQIMKESAIDDGQIINICSMSGHRLTKSKDTSFYAATKFAVRALTEGVRAELRDRKTNIRISEISPGMVETELFERAGGEAHSKKLFKNFKKPLVANDVAETLLYILAAPPHVQIHDVLMRSTEQVS